MNFDLSPIDSSAVTDGFEYEKTLWLTFYAQTQAYGGPEEGGWYYPVGHSVCSFPIICRGKLPTHAFEPEDGEEPRFLDLVQEYWPDAMMKIALRAQNHDLQAYIKQACASEVIEWGDPTSSRGGYELTWQIEEDFGMFSYPATRPTYQ